MHYRNRVVLGAASAAVVAQPFVALYVLLTSRIHGEGLVNAAALLCMASFFAWLFARLGIQPSVSCEHGVISVHNPLLSYRAPIREARFVARNGTVALHMGDLGAVSPWALSRSVFDGARARTARRRLRELITEAQVAAPPGGEAATSTAAAVRWVRRGLTDLLLLPPLAFAVWNVVDISLGN
ncbi:hypothetical protein ACWELO_01985 [Streptomyces sp. NPDC004596]|uniref:hypothetical protein n=1 Tax=Streptomyces sp. DSM 118148 TaxID=3448667 RepID=UPI0040402479